MVTLGMVFECFKDLIWVDLAEVSALKLLEEGGKEQYVSSKSDHVR